MTILYFVTALLVFLSRLQTPEAKTGYSLLLNFGGCKCDPNWVCPDGRTWVSQNGITMGFERPGVLRGRRTRLCNHLSTNWRTFVHFSAQNKYCIKNLENGKYFYELVMGDCKFNTYNKLNIDDQVTVAHYQTDNQPKLFTGLLTVSNKQLCLWDPRTPLANRDTILEIVDGCGYPQPTRVSVMKLVQVTASTPCSSSPCKNNGTCTVKGTGFTCKCATGYTGTTCTTKPTVSSNTSACNDNKCKNDSICKANTSSNSSTPGSSSASIGPGGNSSSSSSSSNSSTGYTCSCKPGYTGTYCQTPSVACSSSSCTNGTCKVTNNKITCTCSANWYGDKCATQCNDSHKCTNGSCKSVTTNGVTVKKCSCKSGWYGEYCNVQCNAANPCKHGTCTSTTVSGNKVSVCKCKSGWTGASCNQETAVIVREEKVFVKLGNKRVCITLRKEGSTWTYYRENKKTGEMKTFNPPPGFKWQVYLNGETVIIQGKQATKKSPHAHLVTVKIHGKSVKLLLQLEKGKWVPYYKKNGTWTCFHPPPGFSLTVKIGNDIIRIKPEQTYQKVKIKAHGKEVLIYMMRVNNHWTPFYKKNGVLRSYHAPMGTHVMVRIGHEETVIEHRKPCSIKPCKNGGSCTDEGVTFHCACGANWSGASCAEMRKVPACRRNTCGPHGTCIELGHNTVQCHCRKGWAGVRCNIAITCPPLSCSNGGIMVHLHNSAHCQCPVGFVGKCCQKRVPACSLDPCNQRGLCEQTGHNYKCHCHGPYTGMNCEIVRRVRQCIVGIQRFAVGHIMRQNCNRCVCLEDGHLVCTKRRCPDMHFVAPRHVKAEIFEGHLCGHSPCVHGGCRSFHFRPRCQCQQGYTGTTCETEIHVEQVQHVYHRRTYEHHSVELHRHHPTLVEHRDAEVYRHHPVLVQHRQPIYHRQAFHAEHREEAVLEHHEPVYAHVQHYEHVIEQHHPVFEQHHAVQYAEHHPVYEHHQQQYEHYHQYEHHRQAFEHHHQRQYEHHRPVYGPVYEHHGATYDHHGPVHETHEQREYHEQHVHHQRHVHHQYHLHHVHHVHHQHHEYQQHHQIREHHEQREHHERLRHEYHTQSEPVRHEPEPIIAYEEHHEYRPTPVEHFFEHHQQYRHHRPRQTPVEVVREPVYYHHRHHRRVVDDRQYHHPIIHRDVIVQGPVEREHVEYVDICGRVDCGRGSCNVLNRQPHCICRHGWDGATCMNRVHIEYRHRSPCSSVRCHHGGSCITRWRQASCMCPQQFSGRMCEIDLGRTHYFGR